MAASCLSDAKIAKNSYLCNIRKKTSMLSQNERKRIIALINREVVPAIGCTEPIAVALCTARAAELLGSRPEKVAVRLSAVRE